jgi:hypothetical protein
MTYAVYLSVLLALWSIARQYPAKRKPSPLPLGGWDLAAERE